MLSNIRELILLAQVVVELMEDRNPPGVFCVLDDVCATQHAVNRGVDFEFQKASND